MLCNLYVNFEAVITIKSSGVTQDDNVIPRRTNKGKLCNAVDGKHWVNNFLYDMQSWHWYYVFHNIVIECNADK